jgi:hypothetical protein
MFSLDRRIEVFEKWHKFRQKYGFPEFNHFWRGNMQLLGLMNREIIIDTMLFDDWLHERFGNYEDDNKSIKDICKEKFGQDVVDFLDEMYKE